jgi:outer membrane receptor protein involved in Fe transport
MQRDGQGVTSWRDAYPRFDAHLARPLRRDVDLAVNVQNVLDRRPAQWAGFTGRQATVSLSWAATF